MYFDPNYHSEKCDNPDVEYSEGYELAGLGETVERSGKCKTCGKNVREIWVYSCELIDDLKKGGIKNGKSKGTIIGRAG